MKKELKRARKAIDELLKVLGETEVDKSDLDKAIDKLHDKVASLEEELNSVVAQMQKLERKIHKKVNKIARVKKLILKADTDRKLKTYEKDYERLMRELKQLDKEYARLREKYESLVLKEEKALEKEMFLEEEAAKLAHRQYSAIAKLQSAMGDLSAQLNRY
ncbi:hypothetical protein [Hydrogenimonas sp.]